VKAFYEDAHFENQYFLLVSFLDKMTVLWRASQLLHVCLVDKPVIPLYITLYPVTLICIHICVQKYTSVYLLLSTNSFAFVFRVLLYWRPE
jgi:hypothetical protein